MQCLALNSCSSLCHHVWVHCILTVLLFCCTCVCSAIDDFNHGVVLSNRPLRSNEVFQVRIDKMVDKWAGSIEIGVTTHNPAYLQLPSTMTNLRSGKIWELYSSLVLKKQMMIKDDRFEFKCLNCWYFLGTWMMTGNGVMHNGTTILDEYGHNLDRLKVNICVFSHLACLPIIWTLYPTVI